MYRPLLILHFLIFLLLLAQEGNAQEAQVNNYLKITYQQQQREGPLRYMTFHDHNPQYNITSGYHQHLYYSPFDTSIEQFKETAIEGQYYLNSRTLVRARIPYLQNVRKGTDSTTVADGIGDIELVGSYQVYNSALFSQNEQVKNIFFVGVGAKVPSGKFANFDALNELEPNFQPGRGNFSILLEASWWMEINNKWHSLLKADYDRHLANDYDYIFGPQWQIQWQGSWTTTIGQLQLVPSTAASFTMIGQDVLQNVPIPEETARKTLWWTVGMTVAYNAWHLQVAYKQPLWETLTGVQLDNKGMLSLELAYWFPTKEVASWMKDKQIPKYK